MKRTYPAFTFLLNVVGIIIGTILLAPLAMPIVDLLSGIISSVPVVLDAHKYPGGYDYARVWRTVNQIVIMAFVFVNMRQMGFTSLASVGLPFQSGWRVLLWQGFFWGLIAYLITVGVALLLGARYIHIRTPWWLWLKEPFEFFLSGAAAGIVEEIIFRGMFFPILVRWIGTIGSMLVTSVLYGSFHLLVDAKVPVKFGVIDWGVGIRGLQEHIWVLLYPRENFFPAFFGLFLMSVVLTYTFLWTGDLYFPIGLHAAWVFIDKSDNLFLNNGGLRKWLFGNEGMGPAIIGWIVMALFLLYVAFRYRGTHMRDVRLKA